MSDLHKSAVLLTAVSGTLGLVMMLAGIYLGGVLERRRQLRTLRLVRDFLVCDVLTRHSGPCVSAMLDQIAAELDEAPHGITVPACGDRGLLLVLVHVGQELHRCGERRTS